MRKLITVSAIIVSTLLLATVYATTLGDIDKDGDVGLPEAAYALQVTAGIRSTIPTTSGEISLVHVAERLLEDSILMTVPSDKTFVLTDLVASGSGSARLLDAQGQQVASASNGYPVNLSTGIVYDSNTDVRVQVTTSPYVLISGYMIQN
nr:hypothetical protein 5 [Desulfobacterales bacterium]